MLFFSVCFGNSILYCWFALRTKQYHCATRHLGAPAVGHFVGHFRGSIVGHRVGHFYVRLFHVSGVFLFSFFVLVLVLKETLDSQE